MTPQEAPGAPLAAESLRLAYVIAPPALVASKAWPAVRAKVWDGIRNARPALFPDLFDSPADYAARWPEVAATLAGAVVIPQQHGTRLYIGPRALDEARHVRALGKPVLVFGLRGFLHWQSLAICELRKRRPGIAAELILPGAPGAKS